MTKIEVSKLVAVLMACYPNTRFPDGAITAYETFLVELELERARSAVRNVVRESKFLPTIAEIITAYEALAPREPDTSYRLFRPARVDSPMAPRELKLAIDEALEAMK